MVPEPRGHNRQLSAASSGPYSPIEDEDLFALYRLHGGDINSIVQFLARQWGTNPRAIAPMVYSWLAHMPPRELLPLPSRSRSSPALTRVIPAASKHTKHTGLDGDALARVPAAIPGVSPASAVTDFALPDGFWKQSGAAEGWEAACGLDPRMTLVSMGNPHAVLWCTDVARVPLDVVGPFAERHPWFPERMNVHFVQVLGPGEVRMRTWERGSGATQACGTGASAVCVAGVLTVRTQSPLLAHLPGGDLVLEWTGAEAAVRMTGPAVEVFQGALDLGAQPVGQAR
jgi:hypothetical protein